MYFVKILLINLVIRKSPLNSKHCRFGHVIEQEKIVTQSLIEKYYISCDFELHGPYYSGRKAPSLKMGSVFFFVVVFWVVLHIWYMIMSQLYIIGYIVSHTVHIDGQ